MPTINFILQDGNRRSIDVKRGTSVMEAAIRHNIRGIDGECGGSCSCATCHVYVQEEFLPLLTPADDIEDELLDVTASPRQPNSRLGCQISMADELDGLVVRIPDRQI